MKTAFITLLISLFCLTAFSRRYCRPNNYHRRPCYIGGCSGQICSPIKGVISTCEWRDEYACYRSATCERQANGQCGWTSTPELEECLENAEHPQKCYVGGCSGQLCSDDPNAMSTCEWREEYACYTNATCERQTDGQCGWTSTPELEQCLNDSLQHPFDQCYVGGCSSELCSEDPGAVSDCIWRDEYACYQSATCERQADEQCGWTSTPELEQCLQNPPEPTPQCYAGGCSGQLCTDDPNAVSTCEWTAAYACYANATCERQTDGQCGWTSTPELEQCLQNPPEPTPQCYAGGCSGQLCTDDPNAVSTCEWTAAYACYRNATCERQTNGSCGWTSTAELEQCLANPPNDSITQPPQKCFIGGCSNQICTDDPHHAASTCVWREEYACYRNTTCERQSDGQCGWTKTPGLEECLENSPGGPVVVDPPQRCYARGCSGQICSDNPHAMGTCEWRQDYRCYKNARCERQGDGQCGWTSTPELAQCLKNPPGGPVVVDPPQRCYARGCSGQICSDNPNAMGTCEWREEYRCYKNARCERQGDGKCGWTSTPDFERCWANAGTSSS